MAQSKRTPASGSTTPALDRNTKHSFWIGLAKVIAVPMIPLLLLAWFGSPALRMSYRWDGNHQAPVYSHCLYLNLTSGWEYVDPRYGVNNCPLIAFFPFDIINFIKG